MVDFLSLPALKHYFSVYSKGDFKYDLLQRKKSAKMIIKRKKSRKSFINTLGPLIPVTCYNVNGIIMAVPLTLFLHSGSWPKE